MGEYIMTLDEGTTSARCIIYDRAGKEISVGQREFKQIFPHDGWVEHDAMEIYLRRVLHIGISTLSA